MKAAQEFLRNKEQVRIVLVLRGRQRGRQSSGIVFLEKIHNEYLAEVGKLVKAPTEGNLSLTYNPMKH